MPKIRQSRTGKTGGPCHYQYQATGSVRYQPHQFLSVVNSLIDNLDQTNNLKVNLKRKLATIYNSTSIVEYVDKKSNSARSETVKDRVVEPFAFSTNLVDVWAYDLEDLHNKVFKISRLGEVETLDEDWELSGEYGIDDVALSVPCYVGATGAFVISGIKHSDEEHEALMSSAKYIRCSSEGLLESNLIDKVKKRLENILH